MSRFELAFLSSGPAVEVDRDKRILYGVQVAMLGEAKGHGMELDQTTLNQIVALGNAAPRGVKARFGHPTECTPGLGTVIGYRKNFRVDGDYVKADLHLLEPDPEDTVMRRNIAHVMAMAEQAPDKIGNSVVITAEREDREKPLMPLVRVQHLHAVDVVDEPASGTGMFAQPIDGVKFSPRTIVELRNAASKPGFIDRAISFFLNRKPELAEDTPTAEGVGPEANPEETDMTMSLTELKEKYPEALKQFKTELSQEFEGQFKEGAEQERKRVAAIVELCKPCHFIPTDNYPKGFGAHAIASGMEVNDQTKEMFSMYESVMKGRKLDALTAASAEVDAGAAPHENITPLSGVAANDEKFLSGIRAKYAKG